MRKILGLLVLLAGVTGVLSANEPTVSKGAAPQVLQLSASGTANYGQVTIPYMLSQIVSLDGRRSGSVLYYVPPIDLLRDAAGDPQLGLLDPVTLGEYTLPGAASPCTPRELAEGVRMGAVPPDAKILLTLRLRLHSHPGIQAVLLEALRNQVSNQVEDPTLRTWKNGTLSGLHQSVLVLSPSELVLTSQTPGLELDLRHKGGLKQDLNVQGVVPARVVSGLLSNPGLELRADFHFLAYDLSSNRGTVSKVANDVVETLVRELGKGKLTQQAENIEIAADRDSLQRLAREIRWSDRIDLRGNDTKLLNQIGLMLQNRDRDIFATSSDDMQSFLERFYQPLKDLQEPSFADLLDSIHADKKVTDEQIERFNQLANSSAERKSGGGGFALGPIAFSNAGGYTIDRAACTTQQSRDQVYQFLETLRNYRKSGHFKVPPSLNLTLVSSARLQHRMETEISVLLVGAPTSRTLSSSFGSRSQTLPLTTPTLADVLEREKLLSATDGRK